MEVDRAHRLPKPSHIPEKLPRDVRARIHFYGVKELMQYTRHSPLPDPHADILYSDLSQVTICKNLNSIGKIPQNHSIIYKWRFSTKILDHKGISFSINNLEQGLKILRSWAILPNNEDNITDKSTLGKISQDWQKSQMNLLPIARYYAFYKTACCSFMESKIPQM